MITVIHNNHNLNIHLYDRKQRLKKYLEKKTVYPNLICIFVRIFTNLTFLVFLSRWSYLWNGLIDVQSVRNHTTLMVFDGVWYLSLYGFWSIIFFLSRSTLMWRFFLLLLLYNILLLHEILIYVRAIPWTNQSQTRLLSCVCMGDWINKCVRMLHSRVKE